MVGVSLLASGLPGRPATAAILDEIVAPVLNAAAATLLDVGPLDPADLNLLQRTETTNVFVRPDGTGELRSYGEAVNWQAPDGRWVPFDTSIITAGLGRFRNRSGPVTTSFAGITGTGPLVHVETEDWSVKFDLAGRLPGVGASIDGHTVHYPSLLGGADLRYTMFRDHVKEVLSLPNRAAAGDGVFRFPLTLSGIEARQDDDGSIGFYDPAGIRQAFIPQGVAYDSSADPEAGIEPRSGIVAVRLIDGAVEIEAPRSLLDDPATVWPLHLDPDVRFGRDARTGIARDSFVRSDNPTRTYNGSGAEALGGQFSPGDAAIVAKAGYTGYPSATVEYNSYFLYDLSAANNQTIISGEWIPYVYVRGVGSQTPRYVLWPVSDPYNIDAVTFNTRPNHYNGTQLCDQVISKCYVPGSGGLLSHNIQTWVHNWTRTSGGWPNRGIIVDTGGEAYTYMSFGANEDTNPSYIRVVYNLPPSASLLTPNGGFQTTNTPQLCATWTDPNQGNPAPGNPDAGYIVFRVYNSGGAQVWSGQSGTLGNNGQGCVTTGALGQGYHSWSAEADDFRTRSAQVWASFTVDSVKPGVPNVSSSTHGVESPPGDQWYAARTVTGAVSGPSGDTSGISGYSVELNQNQDPNYLPAASQNSTGSYGLTTSNSNDGQWYVHARARDNVGWWSDSARHYAVKIDSTPPLQPTLSPTNPSSHVIGVCTSIRTLTVNWNPGSDATSGVLGYSWVFNTDQNAKADSTVDPTTGNSATYTVPVNADGTYWFHAATIDKAGNKSSAEMVYGPICVDGAADAVTLAPTLSPDMVAQSDQVGLEQFGPYKSFPLGSGTGYAQLRSGNLVASFEDATIPGQGLNTVINHVYNSQRQHTALHDNGLGQGWSLSISDLAAGLEGVEGAIEDFDLAAPITSAKATVIDGAGTITGQILEFSDGDGTTHRFIRKGGLGGRWDSPPGVSLRVREIHDGTTVSAYELVRPDGVVYKATNVKTALGLTTNTWKVTEIRDRHNTKLTFAYELRAGKPRLTTITHSRHGVAATLTWDTTTGRLSQLNALPGITGPQPITGTSRSFERQVRYTYNGSGQLSRIDENTQSGSDGARATEFGYTAGLLTSVKDPNSIAGAKANVTKFAYTGTSYDAKVTTITDRRQSTSATPTVWTLAYGVPDPTSGEQDTVVTSPVADQMTYRTSGRKAIQPTGADRRIAGGNIIASTDTGYGNGPTTSTYTWAANRLTSVKDPLGNERTQSYDDLGMLIEVTKPAPDDPGRLDLPAGAPKQRIRQTLTYRYSSPYPTSGTCPATGGDCFVSDLTRTIDGTILSTPTDTSQQRVVDYVPDPTTGKLLSRIELWRADGTTQIQACSTTAGACTGDRISTFTYYPWGAIKTIDGPRGETPGDGVHPADDITTYGDPADATNGGYDRSGQPKRIADAAGKIKAFVFSPWGPVLEEQDRDGRVSQFRYDDRDNLVETKDPRGQRTVTAFDANDNQTRNTSARGLATGAPDDFTTIRVYDANDWLAQSSEPAADGVGRRTSTFTYFDDGQRSFESTPRGGSQVAYTHHPNRTLKRVDAPGQSTAAADRAITDYFYDNAGRLIQVDGPVANAAGNRSKVTTTYTPSGAVATETETLAGQTSTTRFAYNAHGEQIETLGPRTVGTFTQKTAETFDSFGRTIRTRRYKDTSSWTTIHRGFDPADNQVRVTQPIGSVPTNACANDGEASTSDRNPCLEALYRYDVLGRLSAQTKDPVNTVRTVEYAYEAEGNQTERVEKESAAEKRRTSTRWNDDGTRRSEISTAVGAVPIATCHNDDDDVTIGYDGASPATGYDVDDNPLAVHTVTGITDCSAAGGTVEKVVRSGYAAGNNWLTSRSETVRSPETGIHHTRSQTLDYEADGALDRLVHSGSTDGATTVNYDYSPAGWLTSLTDWRARTSTWTYFPTGAAKTASLNNSGLTGTFDYTPDGMASAMTWTVGATTLRSHSAIGYDTGKLRTAETISLRPQNTTSNISGTANWSYDALDRLTGWAAPFAESSGGPRNVQYTLDDGANVTQELVRDGATIGAGNTESTITLGYTNGLLATRLTTSPVLLSNKDCENFFYNALGEEIGRYFGTVTPAFACPTNPTPTRASSYDAEGHTTGHDDRRGLLNDDVNYAYDAAGQITARIDPTGSGSTKTTLYFTRPGGGLAEEASGTGQTMVRYLVDNSGTTLAEETWRTTGTARATSPTWSWLLPDLDGNVATTVDDTGAVKEQAAYDPYGAPRAGGASKATSHAPSSLGYQAALTDRDEAGATRAVLLTDRQYDPRIRRFTSLDTYAAADLDLALGTDPLTGNRYVFAAANPCSYSDDGHGPKKKPEFGAGKCHAHHIVARKAPQAGPAREVLAKHDISIESERNIVYIDADAHIKIIHGSDREGYYLWVNERLDEVRDSGKRVRSELADIKEELHRRYACKMNNKQILKELARSLKKYMILS